MPDRLTTISTKVGDKGTTRLGDNAEVSKDHPRISALGSVDELNSALGVVLAENIPERMRRTLSSVQCELFDLGGELCVPGHSVIGDEHVTRLEVEMEGLLDGLPPLKDFILPGGTRAAAACHMARTVARRAERDLAGLARKEMVSPETMRYLNRLSDFLFVAARVINRDAGIPDTPRGHDPA